MTGVGGNATKVTEKDLVSHRCKLQNQEVALCSPCSISAGTHMHKHTHTDADSPLQQTAAMQPCIKTSQ